MRLLNLQENISVSAGSTDENFDLAPVAIKEKHFLQSVGFLVTAVGLIVYSFTTDPMTIGVIYAGVGLGILIAMPLAYFDYL